MGVTVEVTKAADGPKPQRGQRVTVHCTGYVAATGAKFWRSLARSLARARSQRALDSPAQAQQQHQGPGTEGVLVQHWPRPSDSRLG